MSARLQPQKGNCAPSEKSQQTAPGRTAVHFLGTFSFDLALHVQACLLICAMHSRTVEQAAKNERFRKDKGSPALVFWVDGQQTQRHQGRVGRLGDHLIQDCLDLCKGLVKDSLGSQLQQGVGEKLRGCVLLQVMQIWHCQVASQAAPQRAASEGRSLLEVRDACGGLGALPERVCKRNSAGEPPEAATCGGSGREGKGSVRSCTAASSKELGRHEGLPGLNGCVPGRYTRCAPQSMLRHPLWGRQIRALHASMIRAAQPKAC